MTDHRPFREVKLQWLQQLSCDKDLSDNARSVALYIVTTHMNGHTEKAWPSYQTIAEATSKSVKTIQRAIRELEANEWFEVQRGNGIGHKDDFAAIAAQSLAAMGDGIEGNVNGLAHVTSQNRCMMHYTPRSRLRQIVGDAPHRLRRRGKPEKSGPNHCGPIFCASGPVLY